MDRHPVSSTNIAAIGYDAALSEMDIEFKNGSVHRYFGVPELEYRKLLAAPSKGSHFHHCIKEARDGQGNKKYRSEKIAEATVPPKREHHHKVGDQNF